MIIPGVYPLWCRFFREQLITAVFPSVIFFFSLSKSLDIHSYGLKRETTRKNNNNISNHNNWSRGRDYSKTINRTHMLLSVSSFDVFAPFSKRRTAASSAVRKALYGPSGRCAFARWDRDPWLRNISRRRAPAVLAGRAGSVPAWHDINIYLMKRVSQRCSFNKFLCHRGIDKILLAETATVGGSSLPKHGSCLGAQAPSARPSASGAFFQST